MNSQPSVSIIIPAKKFNTYLKETLPKILEQDYQNFEVIIVFDKRQNLKFEKTTELVSGSVGPAVKRDLAAKKAKGEILAFLDDDAYPAKNWLTKAISAFSNSQVAAVGGPAITPQDDVILAKASGAVFESYLGGGLARDRYLSLGSSKEIKDWPTVNLLVRRDVFNRINGFDTKYWPGEDTKLCLDIINLGFKIVYEPEAIVFHHRRPDLKKHLMQISNYATHRGFFAKAHPETSFKLWYFVPSSFVLYLIFLLFFPAELFFLPLYLYIVLLLLDSLLILLRYKNLVISFTATIMIFLTHVFYGINFVKGLLLIKLDN